MSLKKKKKSSRRALNSILAWFKLGKGLSMALYSYVKVEAQREVTLVCVETR
jgi:hypothetical protein